MRFAGQIVQGERVHVPRLCCNGIRDSKPDHAICIRPIMPSFRIDPDPDSALRRTETMTGLHDRRSPMQGPQIPLSDLPGDLPENDVAELLRVLVSGSKRVEPVDLSSGRVWIKRYGTEVPGVWMKLQGVLSRLVPVAFLRPSPLVDSRSMVARELQRMAQFGSYGFPVPPVIYSSGAAMVLRDVSPTVQEQLDAARNWPAEDHDALLVACARSLGQLHAAGLCHGRPHPRDMFLDDGQIGFMDFEEHPQEVMPLAVAQARDLWLLFLQVATRSRLGTATCEKAFAAWREAAPAAAMVELRRMTVFLARFLPLARLIGRVRMGSDLRRFIKATEFLMNTLEHGAARTDAGMAGHDDRN